uniref:DNA primase large subunit n=1 Tax=Elaeophora elaphi TaxID=1147741 RepID=A0A0R3RR54_9BILA
MQFEGSPRSISKFLAQNLRRPIQRGPRKMEDLNLQMYLESPTEDITLLEFQELALNRLRVLKVVEQVKDRFPRGTEAINDELSKQLMKLMPIACGCCPFEELESARRRDVISHFILRLAFCQTPEQTKWFIQQEVDLFKFRFQIVSKSRDAVAQFLKANNFNAQLVTDAEKENLKEELSNACFIPLNKVTSTDFWKVPFEDALDLVRKRRAFLVFGYAFVSEDDLQVILCTRLRLNIAAAMARACRNIVFIEEDDRLMPFLNKLSSRSYVGKNYVGTDASRITPDMVDSLATTSFPLCMRNIHNRLRADHHLRHGARMQYGLFLKGIGMTLEDALLFWRAEFTKKMDSDKFDKQYAYNIRHNYGKEGKHADYSAYPCTKIILDLSPSSVDCHGCPYRHSELRLLTQILESSGLSRSQIEQIILLLKNTQYDKACTRYFEFTHKMAENTLGTVITHPNQYFELSRQVHEGRRNREEEPKHEVTSNTLHVNATQREMDVDIEDLIKMETSKVNRRHL